jgi:two-component system sensor histidine kinase ChvG
MTGLGWLPRPSMRVLVAFLVVAMAVTPLLIVVTWLGVERLAEGSMKRNARASVAEAATATSPEPWAAVRAVAARRLVRVRVIDRSGAVIVDHDFDRFGNWSERAGGFFLGPHRQVESRELDSVFGRIADRPEFHAALQRGTAEGCRDVPDSDLVACYAARLIPASGVVLYAEDGSERLLAPLYDLRRWLGRLTVVILPFAVALAVWSGRRIVVPIERLRAEVLAKVREPRPKPGLSVPRATELADLAAAFDTLLEHLAERGRENEAFVADLVHEFKNPVAAIRVAADTLAASNGGDARLERTARVLRDSSVRLDALVTQFLKLAQAEAGMTGEPRETVDLAALSSAVAERLRADGRFEGATVIVEVAGSAPVLGVEDRLESVVENLLANALSFAGPTGTVQLRVAVRDGEVLLTVSDDGPGIAPADLSQVFDRFFTTRRHDKGTGLGLSLVRAVVEAHGGTVGVESVLGRGATFTARLPELPE